MDEVFEIPDEVHERLMRPGGLAIWSLDPNPLSDSYQIARYFQDQGWRLYPINERTEKLLDEICYRDIRLIPDDYDVLMLFVNPDALPETVNAIFNADFVPPIVWAHSGIFDEESFDRMVEAGIKVVMDRNMMDCHRFWVE
jgi:uncharacterized protein